MFEANPKNREHQAQGDWLEATVQFHGDGEETLATFLSECLEWGAVGGIDESAAPGSEAATAPQCESCGKPVNLKVYFPQSSGFEQVFQIVDREARAISRAFPGTGAKLVRCRLVKREDWAADWRLTFPPEKVSEHLWVVPPWDRPVLSPPDIPIILEPGLAFGTGKHATTRHCLGFIEELLSQRKMVPRGFLDVGCGSGILAIAGKKLGAERVVGLDLDPDAVQTARNNLKLNRLSRGVLLVVGPPQCCRGPFDLIAANLTAPVLAECGTEFRRLLSPGGFCILSGMLDTEKPRVARVFQKLGFHLDSEKTDPQEGWSTLLFHL